MKLVWDKNTVAMRLKGLAQKSITVVTNEALKDASELCPTDSGELMRSGIRNSQPEKGLLIWDTPYAKYQYYGVSKSGKQLNYKSDGTPSHPQATSLWAHKGFERNREKYKRMAQKVISGGE